MVVRFILFALILKATIVSSSPWLENWMGNTLPVISNRTILDLSLPGTHDTLTYDLSTTVSDNANDLPSWVAWLLHLFHDAIGIGKFIRHQACCEGLNITSQLNAGIRFLDFRVVYSAPPKSWPGSAHDWFSLHLVESNQPALQYLKEIKLWMDSHPQEIVVIWLSRHGSTCNTQYPGTNTKEEQAFWKQITDLFGSLLLDNTKDILNTTTIGSLVESQRRVLMYVSQPPGSNFTGDSQFAYDGCTIDNQLGDSTANEWNSIPLILDRFRNASEIKAADKKKGSLYLQSLAGGAPSEQQVDAALLTFQPFDHDSIRTKCAKAYNITNMTNWCPMTLMDSGLLNNYYVQRILESVAQSTPGTLDLPNAIYLNGVDEEGTIRTGTELFGPIYPPSNSTEPHGRSRYCYVDTMIQYNVKLACQNPAVNASVCQTLLNTIEQRRALYPMQQWNDAKHGRLIGWPPSWDKPKYGYPPLQFPPPPVPSSIPELKPRISTSSITQDQ